MVNSYVIEPELHVSQELFLRETGLPPAGALAEDAIDLFLRGTALLHPKALYAEATVSIESATEVEIGGELFESRFLVSNLRDAGQAYPYVATCGVQLDELVDHGDDLERYLIEVLEEQAMEAAFESLERAVAGRYGLDGMASMNPGSAEAGVWEIEQQRALFHLLGDVESSIGVRLTESCLMIPRKSISGVLFPTRAGWVSCEVCSRDRCRRRRAPYDPRKSVV